MPLLQPFLRLDSQKLSDDQHSCDSDDRSCDEMPPCLHGRISTDLAQDDLVAPPSLLDSPTRTMTTDELMEMYLDEFDSVDIKELSHIYSPTAQHQAKGYNGYASLPTVALNPDAMEIEGQDAEETSKLNLVTVHGIVQSNSKPPCCTCKRSKCLKLYCECFRNNGFCSAGCSCTECYNRVEYADIREMFLDEQLQRNPETFSSKVITVPGQSIMAKGCNCKKTECQKNYCECFAAGVKCSHLCHCTGCKNCDASAGPQSNLMTRDRLIKKRRKSEKNFLQSLKERLDARKVLNKDKGPPVSQR